MSDQVSQEDGLTLVNGIPLPSRQTRKRLVVGTLLFCASVITYVIGWGHPENSLHSSGLAWAFATATATLFAYVFGAVVDNWNVSTAIKK